MSNILEELYYNNIEVQLEKSHITPKLRAKLSKLCEKEDLLKEELSEKTLKMFNEYIDQSNEYLSLCCCDNFMCGFKYGARFIHDAFVDGIN